MSKLLIAIDPGLSGAIVCRTPRSKKTQAYKMPDTPQEIYELLKELRDEERTRELLGSCFVLMENVGHHRMGNSASSSVKFSRHVGHLEMALIAAELPHATVVPTVWMNAIAPTRPKGIDSVTVRKRKNHIKDLMQRQYPSLHVTNATADALGILTYMIQEKEKYA